MADSPQSSEGRADWRCTDDNPQTSNYLDQADTQADHQSAGTSERPSARNVDRMGSGPISEAVQVCRQAELEIFRLKTSELVCLLNSTSLGTVISERQLYRHRQRSGGMFFKSGKNCILTYIGWLIDERHRRQMKRANGGDTSVNLDNTLRLLEDQNFRCALSGTELTPDTTALDHILPVSRGGDHLITNAQALTKDINRAKGTMTNDEFIDMCRRVVRWQDRDQ